MAATLLKQLKAKFPDIGFVAGARFSWSPAKREVIFCKDAQDNAVDNWSLLHEVGHALLEHDDYETDFELLQLEVEAWQKAEEIAEDFCLTIDKEHIQDCLDTYRDWLYQRSTCPRCTNCSLQSGSKTYRCFNCDMSWHVSSSRLCRPYRRKQKEAAKIGTSPVQNESKQIMLS